MTENYLKKCTQLVRYWAGSLIFLATAAMAQESETEATPPAKDPQETSESSDSVELQETVLTGENFEQPFSPTTTITELDGQYVESLDPVNSYSLLRMIPGVFGGLSGNDRFGGPVSIRGGVTWGISEAIDGYPAVNVVPVAAEDGGYTAGLSTIIPSIAIRSIGVETGATGVEYGQSTGGVIQTQLKTGNAANPYGTLYSEYNTVGEVIGMAEYSGGSGAWDYYVAGQAVYGDYGDNYESFTRQLEDLTLYSGLAKIGFRPNELGRFEVLFIGGEEDHHYLQDREDGDVRYKTKKDNLFLAARYDHITVNETKWDIGATYNDFHENRINLETDQSERNRPQEQYNLFSNISKDIELNQSWNWFTVNGVQYTDDTFSDITNDEKRFDFSDASIYTRNSFTWEDTVILNAGLRGSRIDNGYRDLNKVSYDLGAAVEVPVVGQFHVSNYTGYNLNKAYYLFWGGGEFIDRDPQDGLKPTETYTWEVGWEKAFTLMENPGSARITYFHTKETNLFNFGNTGSGVPFYDEGVSEGVEAWFEWNPIETLNLFAGYAHIDNRRTGSTNPNASNLDLQFTPLPDHSASVGASWMFVENWFFTASGIYNSGYQREFYDQNAREVETFNDFFQVDVAVSWNINERFTVFGRIENLLNEKDLGYSSVREESDGTTTEIDADQEDPGILFAFGGEIHF